MDHKEIIYGCAYYAEYIPYDRVEEDIRMMKDAGINTVRIAESTWSTEEPGDNIFEFSYVDHVLDEIEKNGMNAIVGTPTYALPSWLVRKHPEFMVTQKNGQVKYGPRQSMDIFNPDFRTYAQRIIRKLISHVSSRKCVIGYQIDNETKHYENFGPFAQKAFKENLKKIYETPEALNQAFTLNYWSNAIHSWDDFPDISNSINFNLLCAYENFLRQGVTDYLLWQSSIVKECKKPKQFITHNFDFDWRIGKDDESGCAHTYGVQPQVNHYSASTALDIAGCDIYHPSGDFLTGAEIAFGGDSTRCLKNKNYLVAETESQAFKYWTPYPGQLTLQAYSHLASGADGVSYWGWQSIANSFETYWKGILSHDFKKNEVYKEISLIGNELKKLSPQIIHLQKKNKIALVVDNDSLTALKYFPIDSKLTYNDVVRCYYDCLYEMNIECDIVDINGLNPELYEAVIIPAMYCISEEQSKMLKDYVYNGGTLIATFKSFFADKKATVYNKEQPSDLTECFGIRYDQFVFPHELNIDAGTDDKICDRSCNFFAELVTSTTADVIWAYDHKYWGKYGCVTRNSYGKGCACYVASFISKEAVKVLLRKVLPANLQEMSLCTNGCMWPLIVRKGINSQEKKVTYIFNYSADNKAVKNIFYEGTEIRSGKIYKMNEEIPLKDWGVAILIEE